MSIYWGTFGVSPLGGLDDLSFTYVEKLRAKEREKSRGETSYLPLIGIHPLNVRVRFAPSPTGYMHVGNVRTALFNWLFARGEDGIFILRIEDTDVKRHVQEAVDAITEGLQWLGIDWDEGPGVGGEFGPYFQSERIDLYHQAAQELVDRGAAYICRCTAEGLDADACTCGEKPGERARSEGEAVRFRNPGGRTIFEDIVQGKLSFENDQFGDFILIKSDGTPTYNFANVVDDNAMRVSHVIRGDDHLSNTPRQIMLYETLDCEPAEFAHLPQILGDDGDRLSKRHGAASLSDFRDRGFIPEAMMNYLALLGWAPEGENDFLNPEQLIDAFRLDRVRQSASQFNQQKLTHLNSQHMENRPLRQRAEIAAKYLARAGMIEDETDNDAFAYIEKIVEALGSRFKYGEQIVEYGGHFFAENVSIDADLHSYLAKDDVRDALSRTADRYETATTWDEETIEDIIRSTAEEFDLKAAPLIHGTRVALSAKTVGPSLFTLVYLVGRERSARRIRAALDQVPPGKN